MVFIPPKLLIEPPVDAIKDGLLPVPEGMMSWRNKNNRWVVLVCGYMSDPDARSEEWWIKATEGLRQDQIDREYRISFHSKAGQLVFPYLQNNPEKFVRPSSNYRDKGVWKIPNNWPIIAGMDYGSTNPTSINFYAIDDNNRWHSIWEFYKPAHYKEIAEVLLSHPLYSRLLKIVVDPSIFDRRQHDRDFEGVFTSVGDLLIDAGVHLLEPANRDRVAGLERVVSMFNQRPGEERETNIYFSSDCPEQIRELSRLIYKTETEKQLLTRNPSEDVEKKEDHSYDSLRYALMSWDFTGDILAKPNSEFSMAVIEDEIDRRYLSEINSLFN